MAKQGMCCEVWKDNYSLMSGQTKGLGNAVGGNKIIVGVINYGNSEDW